MLMLIHPNFILLHETPNVNQSVLIKNVGIICFDFADVIRMVIGIRGRKLNTVMNIYPTST